MQIKPIGVNVRQKWGKREFTRQYDRRENGQWKKKEKEETETSRRKKVTSGIKEIKHNYKYIYVYYHCNSWWICEIQCEMVMRSLIFSLTHTPIMCSACVYIIIIKRYRAKCMCDSVTNRKEDIENIVQTKQYRNHIHIDCIWYVCFDC